MRERLRDDERTSIGSETATVSYLVHIGPDAQDPIR